MDAASKSYPEAPTPVLPFAPVPALIQVPVHTCDAFDCEECRTAPLWRFRDAEGEVWEEEP